MNAPNVRYKDAQRKIHTGSDVAATVLPFPRMGLADTEHNVATLCTHSFWHNFWHNEV